MADNSTKPFDQDTKSEVEETPAVPAAHHFPSGWGGWGFSPLSYLSDLQKAATDAAEEISRNAVEAARTAAKSISDNLAEDSESSKENDTETSIIEEESDAENDKRRKAALDNLERASEESILSQGLKVLDTSVESLTSGAWEAFGTALKGGTTLVHRCSIFNFIEPTEIF